MSQSDNPVLPRTSVWLRLHGFIRSAIIWTLLIASIACVLVGIISRKRPLIFSTKDTGLPTLVKIGTAQAEDGKFWLMLESLGKLEEITEGDVRSAGIFGRQSHRQNVLPADPRIGDGQLSMGPWLQQMGFHVGWSTMWYYSGGTKEDGISVYVRGLHRWLDLSAPDWFCIALFAAYPLYTLIRSPAGRRKRRRKQGLCIKCEYNLTGLPTPRCPECGTRN